MKFQITSLHEQMPSTTPRSLRINVRMLPTPPGPEHPLFLYRGWVQPLHSSRPPLLSLGPEGARGTPTPGSPTFPLGREHCAALPSHMRTAGLPTSSTGLLILPSHRVTPPTQPSLSFLSLLCSPNPLQRTNKLQNLFCPGKISWLL